MEVNFNKHERVEFRDTSTYRFDKEYIGGITRTENRTYESL